MSKHYSKEIADAISQFLTQDGWKYQFLEQAGIFRFAVELEGQISKMSFVLEVHETDYNVYGFIPISAKPGDKEMLLRISEFLHRANYGLRNGNFELDFQDSEIRYKTFVECDGLTAPTHEMICNSIYCVAVVFERYSKGIAKIIWADMDAKTAVAICEHPCEEVQPEEAEEVSQVRTLDDDIAEFAAGAGRSRLRIMQ